MAIFQLKGITKSFEAQPVLHNVSLNVKKGEIVGLLGESGSGKSTLLRVAAGLLDPDAGQVFLRQQAIEPASQRLIAGHPAIKIVHQEYNLSQVLTARENIAYALRFYEKPYQENRIKELLELCHLQEVAHRTVKTLSGGEKQRTAIAQALAEHAQVLLLDEPFAHLDLPNRNRLIQSLRRLVKQMGIACIFVTHQPAEALGLSDQLGILQQGHLVQLDRPETIYRRPLNAYIAQLTGEANLLPLAFCQRYFGGQDFTLLPNGMALVRPEQLRLDTHTSTPVAQAESCWFRGSYYEITLKLNRQKLLVYHPLPLAIRQDVGIVFE